MIGLRVDGGYNSRVKGCFWNLEFGPWVWNVNEAVETRDAGCSKVQVGFWLCVSLDGDDKPWVWL